ncbi:nuclear transport factor 2 family protein [Mycobacterium sp. NPDC050041]|uniref:nuclear transport factor 2 family protein n=1 Tax=Mycobacterium sp. NPDC050041 TaxID=3364293 RepID=UPI003C309462
MKTVVMTAAVLMSTFGMTAVPGAAQTGSLTTEDRLAITDAVTGVGLFADLRQWERVGALLADEVTTDYVSVFGGEPATVTRAALLEQWRATLGGLDATQHQITNVVVSPEGAGAIALSHVRAAHWFDGRSWTLGGVYTHHLRHGPAGWQVTVMAIQRLYEEGDRGVLQAAARS